MVTRGGTALGLRPGVARSLQILAFQQPSAQRALTGPVEVGGSASDGILLPGAPPGAVRLVPCATGLVVEARASGVRAGGRPVPAGARRLLLPGERVELFGHALALASDPPAEGTRALAGALLRDAAAGRAAPIAPHLLVRTGPRAGERVPLEGAKTLGRGRAADVRLPDAEASRVHARVRRTGGAVTVEDLGSKNGVRVNGVRVERGPQPLRPGDEVAVGETVLAVMDPLGALAPAATPVEPVSLAPRVPPPRRLRIPGELAAATLLALSAAALALAS